MLAHRRCGKTVVTVQDLILRAASKDITLDKNKDGSQRTSVPQYAYVAPFRSQAKRTAWEYLKHYAGPIMANKNEGELWVELTNKARITLYGADNPDALRGGYLDGAVLDEYADMRPSLYSAVVRPMLSDYKGWCTFIGTPKGKNAFYQVWLRAMSRNTWYKAMFKASETGLLDASELEDARAEMTEAEYLQEFECSFDAAIRGAYYAKEMAALSARGGEKEVLRAHDYPVHAAWDLGQSANGMMAIWVFQIVLGEIRVLDALFDHGHGFPYYVDKLKEMGYAERTDWVPHDAAVHELGTGKSRIETLSELGCKIGRVPRLSLVDGINAVKLTLPRVWFNSGSRSVSEGAEALRQYRTEWDEVAKTYKDTPNRDWTTDIADAFRYLCIAAKEISPQRIEKPRENKPLNQITYDELMEIEFEPRQKEERV